MRQIIHQGSSLFRREKTEQRRQEEQRLKEKKAKKSNLMHDVGLVILGAILSFLFQLIVSVLFPKL